MIGWYDPHDTIHRLTVLDIQQRGDSLNSLLDRAFGVLIGVRLGNECPAVVLGRQFFQRGCNHTTGHAPWNLRSTTTGISDWSTRSSNSLSVT